MHKRCPSYLQADDPGKVDPSVLRDLQAHRSLDDASGMAVVHNQGGP